MIIFAAISEPSTTATKMVILAGFLAVGLALIHLYAGRLRFLQSTPRSRWLSIGSGVSVAYVFVHILPDLSEAQETIKQSLNTELAFLEHHVYLLALLGLGVFYGLERAAKVSRQHSQEVGNGDVTSAGGVVLNVLKEELPEDRESNFWAFAIGAMGYAALLLL